MTADDVPLASPPFWACEAARTFWEAAEEPPAYPLAFEALDDAVAYVASIRVVPLPRLTDRAVHEWLAREQGRPLPSDAASDAPKTLRGCLLARRHVGLVFIDAHDPADERTFTLAHETAHYLRHALEPRATIERGLGAAALEVLDGLRPTSASEKLWACLRGVDATPYGHWLHRDDWGRRPPAVARLELEADRLACELLAPHAEVAGRARRRGARSASELTELLVAEFGLPLDPARRYASWLRPTATPSAWLAGLRPRSG